MPSPILHFLSGATGIAGYFLTDGKPVELNSTSHAYEDWNGFCFQRLLSHIGLNSMQFRWLGPRYV